MTPAPLKNLLENGDGILQSVIISYLIPSSMFSIAVYDVNYVNNINSILNLRATGKNVLKAIDDDRCTSLMKVLIGKSQKSFTLKERLEILDKSLSLLGAMNLYRRKFTVLNINSRIDTLGRFPLRPQRWEQSVSPYDTQTWYDAKVVGFTTTKIRVHYITWDKKWDQWINVGEFKTRIAEHGTRIYLEGTKLKIGDRVDCLIPGGVWREAKIIDMTNEMATVKCDVRRGGQRDPITDHTYCCYDIIKVPLKIYNPELIRHGLAEYVDIVLHRRTSPDTPLYLSSHRIKPFGRRSRGLAYNASLRL